MNCKSCKRSIDDDSIFCKYCGAKQLTERIRKEVSAPKPRQLRSGNWNAQVMVGGERISITAKTEKEYYAKAKALKMGLLSLERKPDDITLRQAISAYIGGKRNRLQAKTIEQYEYIRDQRFQSIMDVPIHELTSTRVDRAVELELAKPSRKGGTLSPKTVIDAYNLIASVAKKTCGVELRADLPEIQRKFRVILPPEAILPAVKGTDIELPSLLAMWLTLSVSEIRGLTKSKSIRDGKLYIVETVVDVHGTPIRKEGGKETNRPRCLDIPPYIQQLIDQINRDEIEPRNAHQINMRFQKVLEAANLPKMNFHSLRHVAASIMADEQIPTLIAQERGGWKTDYTMKNTYTHAFEQSRLDADRKINARFEAMLADV